MMKSKKKQIKIIILLVVILGIIGMLGASLLKNKESKKYIGETTHASFYITQNIITAAYGEDIVITASETAENGYDVLVFEYGTTNQIYGYLFSKSDDKKTVRMWNCTIPEGRYEIKLYKSGTNEYATVQLNVVNNTIFSPTNITVNYGESFTITASKPASGQNGYYPWVKDLNGNQVYISYSNPTTDSIKIYTNMPENNLEKGTYTIDIWDGSEVFNEVITVTVKEKELTKYTITYNANGGTGTPASQTKTEGQAITLSSTTPTRDGYKFLGWSTSSSATTATYAPGGIYQTDADVILYAVWQSQITYTIKFTANGGTGVPSNITSNGEKVTIPSTIPTKSGYKFLYWKIKETAPEIIISVIPNQEFSAFDYWADSNGIIELIAEWGTTITYNANGGTGAPEPQTKKEGRKLALSSTIPTRDGYKFLGWSTSSSATLATYAAGAIYETEGDTTLYAVWEKELTKYTITYNANGGTGAPASQTKTEGQSITLSSITPTRDGYKFLGWSTSSSATTATYAAGAIYKTEGDVTLYAVWEKELAKYTITYNANGGTGAPASQTKTEGQAITLSSTKPTRDGYKFLGWSTSSSATSATYAAGGIYQTDSNVTLYAVWGKESAKYTITYNANGGTGAPASQTKTEGQAITLSSTTPTRDGYKFLGWSTSSSATTATYQAGGTYQTNSNVTLYAVWEKNSNEKPGDENPGDEKPGDEKPGDENPGDEKPGDEKPGNEKPGDEKPGDEKPGDEKPGNEKPGDEKPGDEKPGDEKPGDEKPGDEKPGDEKPDSEKQNTNTNTINGNIKDDTKANTSLPKTGANTLKAIIAIVVVICAIFGIKYKTTKLS